MSKATTIKEAFANFEKKHGKKAEEADHVILFAQIPPIDKMDASLSTLKSCTQLSLSTNMIEKIANLNALKNLKILSLGRNNIKSLSGLEAVGDTLTELWISYNLIEKLKGIWVLRKLNTLYMIHNKVSDMGELMKLDELPCLETLTFQGNPLAKELDDQYRPTVQTKLKKLKKLDGVTIIRNEEDGQAEQK